MVLLEVLRSLALAIVVALAFLLQPLLEMFAIAPARRLALGGALVAVVGSALPIARSTPALAALMRERRLLLAVLRCRDRVEKSLPRRRRRVREDAFQHRGVLRRGLRAPAHRPRHVLSFRRAVFAPPARP